MRPEYRAELSDALSGADSSDAKSEAADLLRRQLLLARLRVDWELLKFALKAIKAGFNPNQPRVAAGGPDGGQWTSGEGGGSDRVRLASADKPVLGPRALLKIAFELIKLYRSDQGLSDLFGNKVGAVTFANFKGEDVFGSNSGSPTYQRIDRIEADRLRAEFFEEAPERGQQGRMPANAFYHAETTLLLRLARRNGGSLAGESVDVFGDRRLCNNCEEVLPFVARKLGNPTVRIFDPLGERGTIRDGNFVIGNKR